MNIITRKTTWNQEHGNGWLHATVQLQPGDLPADYDDVDRWESTLHAIAETARCLPCRNGGPGQFFAHVPTVTIDYTDFTAKVTQSAGYDI